MTQMMDVKHGPVPDFGPYQTHIFIVFISVSALIVGLRFYSRVVILKYLGVDDWLMLAAWIVMVVYFIVSIYGFNVGLGRHERDVSYKNASTVRKYVWCLEILNPIPLGFLKVSTLAFYLRVMPATRLRPYFKIAIGIITAMTISLAMAFFLQCIPLRGNYQIGPNPTPAHCVNSNILLLFSASLNMSTDLAVIVMPIPTICRMKITLNKKVAVLSVFGAGTLVIIASAIRLKTIFYVNTSVDKAWLGKQISLWSAVEMFAGIITSSAPALQPLITNCFPATPKPRSPKASF